MNQKKPTPCTMVTGLKLNEKMNISNIYRHYWIHMSLLIRLNNYFLLKGSGFRQPPHLCPHKKTSRSPLNNYAIFSMKPSRTLIILQEYIFLIITNAYNLTIEHRRLLLLFNSCFIPHSMSLYKHLLQQSLFQLFPHRQCCFLLLNNFIQ